MEQLAPITDFV